MRVTLQAIANAAGVSTTTVSNVVNGKFGMMAPETREMIERLIKEMNYRPNATGRSLRLARRQAIGLMIIDNSPTFLADPFTTYIAAGLSNGLNRNGFGLLVTGLPQSGLKDALLLRHDQTDALCVMPSGTPAERAELYEELETASQPLLVFQDRAPRGVPDCASVRQDDFQGGRMLAERLIARGAKRLTMLVPSRSWPAMTERRRGVRTAIAAAGDGITLRVVRCGSESQADTQAALAREVARSGVPDVILGGNDRMGVAALDWAVRQGLKVPGDLMITGFNAFEFWQHTTPTLTTVRSPAYEIGERGAELLLARLADGRFSRRETVLEVALQAGGSD